MEKVIIYQRGFVRDRIPLSIYEELLFNLNINDINSKTDNQRTLAGNLEIEKDATNLLPYNFYKYLVSLADNYYLSFPEDLTKIETKIDSRTVSTKNKKLNFKFLRAWLNYQKKYEFNPVHSHSGSLSYVVWLKIPYNLDEELSLPNNINSSDPLNSAFCFVGGKNHFPILVDKSMEGEIILFNSEMEHVVYPFYTSDHYRISFSGNIKTEWVD